MKKRAMKLLTICLLLCICLGAFSGCMPGLDVGLGSLLDPFGDSNNREDSALPKDPQSNVSATKCAGGHAYNKVDLCEICGASYAEEDSDLKIAEYVEHCCVIGYTGSRSDVKIPSKYKGKPVLSIGDEYVFTNNKALRSVWIPHVMEGIGNYAFQGCENLERIDGIEESNVKLIASHAFEDCASLTDISLPDALIYLGEYAFAGCSALTSITIPSNVEAIHYAAFSNCSALEYVSLPEAIVDIGHDAFTNCSSLQSIEIPDEVGCIRGGTFRGCNRLYEISISSNITYIEQDAFVGCYDLMRIFYRDTVEQWHTSFEYQDMSWHSEIPATEVICDNGTVTLK